jgi:hypothetical protein
MFRLRKRTSAIWITVGLYLALTSSGMAAGCLCCIAGAPTVAHHDRHNGCGMPSDTTSSRTADLNSKIYQPAPIDQCFHCSCPCCAAAGTDYSHTVNAPASGELNGLVASGWLASVVPSVEILTGNLGPPGPSAHMPTLISSLRSLVLLI